MTLHPDRRASIEWRYLNDAEFHMRADPAVQAIEQDTGLRLDEHDHSLATLAAAYAIDGGGSRDAGVVTRDEELRDVIVQATQTRCDPPFNPTGMW